MFAVEVSFRVFVNSVGVTSLFVDWVGCFILVSLVKFG